MKSPSILIIDDEFAIRNGARLSLSEEGWSVDTGATGIDGLNQGLAGQYDVILLDIQLPDISGMEILKTLRIKQPDVYVIIMTGFATVKNAVEALKLGAYDYIAKPFDGKDLLKKIGSVLKRKRAAFAGGEEFRDS